MSDDIKKIPEDGTVFFTGFAVDGSGVFAPVFRTDADEMNCGWDKVCMELFCENTGNRGLGEPQFTRRPIK